jgi:DNA-binding NtrC family response regulator
MSGGCLPNKKSKQMAAIQIQGPSTGSELPLRRYTEQVMERTAGNQSRAAAMLGMTRATLRRKLRAFGLSQD